MIVPDHIVNKIADPAERRRHMTAQDATDKYARNTEREMHSKFVSYCLLHGIGFEHEDPSRRSTCQPGWPDFRLFYSGARFLAIEFKVKPNGLTIEQLEVRAMLEGFGFSYMVAYSLAEAIHAVQQQLLKHGKGS